MCRIVYVEDNGGLYAPAWTFNTMNEIISFMCMKCYVVMIDECVGFTGSAYERILQWY